MSKRDKCLRAQGLLTFLESFSSPSHNIYVLGLLTSLEPGLLMTLESVTSPLNENNQTYVKKDKVLKALGLLIFLESFTLPLHNRYVLGLLTSLEPGLLMTLESVT